MAAYHEDGIRRYLRDAFDFEGDIVEAADSMVKLFSQLGVDMYFDGEISRETIESTDIETIFSTDELVSIITECMR